MKASAAAKQIQETPAAGARIGILIVAYNAVSTLRQVLQRIPQKVWDHVEEVVVFDDASPDATFELATGIKKVAANEKLQVFRHEKNLGYGGNQRAGYQYFIEKGFDAVVLLHGDGQYAPELLADMYDPIVKGEADAVFGSRMMKQFGGPLKGGMPLYKYLGNRVLTIYENLSLGLNLTEFHSGYRAYNLHALKKIDFSKMTLNFHFDTEIIVKLHHQGFRIKEIPIPTYYGNEICYVNGMQYAWDVFKSVRRYKRTAASLAVYPEFEEYFVHYPIKESKYSTHYYFRKLAGTGRELLEVGCGKGFFSKLLLDAGNKVWGVDCLPASEDLPEGLRYAQAQLHSDRLEALPELKNVRFEKILFMDVLEHLLDPESVLRGSLTLLQPGGQVLVSVPNAANITVRLSLLFGRFDYTERGILDKTHLHFYTRSTARQLMRSAGLQVERQIETVMPLELAFGISPKNPAMRVINRLLRVATWVFPSLLGYQTILVGRLRRESGTRQ